jgi:hypothetical protein
MKNSYLNGMLNFGIELCVIQKKTKKNQNKLLINQRKEENMSKHSPYILVDCVERKKA